MSEIKSKNIAKLNPFKNFISGMEFNACIGDNSGTIREHRDTYIAEGFKKSAHLIYEGILSDKIFVDVAVYPMFYCCRHSIELYLKVIIKQLLWIYKMKKEEDASYTNIKKNLSYHNIKKLKNDFLSLQKVDPDCKKVFVSELKYFDSLIRDYYFDDIPTAFRYTYKKNQQDINLPDKKLMDIGIFYKKYEKLIKQLEYYDYFCDKLCADYATKTFTEQLSRTQLEKISKQLPPVTSNKFKIEKVKICKKYKLSSNQCSDAINKIKTHRAFSLNIGIENKFKHIRNKTIRKLVELIKISEQIHILKPMAIIKGETKFDDPKKNTQENQKIREQLEMQFQTEGNKFIMSAKKQELAMLLSFVEIWKTGNYCEVLEKIYKRWLNYPVRDSVGYVLQNVCYNSAEKLLNGFKICGQKTYIKIFEKYYRNNNKLFTSLVKN